MKKHGIVRKLRKRYKALKRSAKLLDGTCKAALIHRFRLEYKHINAFLAMLSCRKWAKGLDISTRLKKLYKRSGRIRKLQLQLDAFRHPHSKYGAQYAKALGSALEAAKRRFLKRLSPKIIDQSRDRNIADIKGPFCSGDYRDYLAAKAERIKKVLRGAVSDHKLHAVRKELKRVFYTKSLFKVSDDEERQMRLIYKLSSEKLLERLGRFQDRCNAIDLLAPEQYPELGPQAGRWLSGQQRRLLKGKTKMKKRLSAKLKQIF